MPSSPHLRCKIVIAILPTSNSSYQYIDVTVNVSAQSTAVHLLKCNQHGLCSAAFACVLLALLFLLLLSQPRAFRLVIPVQVAAAPGMQAGLHSNRPSGLQQIASLLSGHQTAAAAVVAASMGDVRLATLISQVICSQYCAHHSALRSSRAELLLLHFGLHIKALAVELRFTILCEYTSLHQTLEVFSKPFGCTSSALAAQVCSDLCLHNGLATMPHCIHQQDVIHVHMPLQYLMALHRILLPLLFALKKALLFALKKVKKRKT